jgi:hypothetical protein
MWTGLASTGFALSILGPQSANGSMFSLILKDEQPLAKRHCCEELTAQVNMTFPQAESPLLGSTDKRIYWSPIYDEYGLICQPSAEILRIQFCPFCGTQLPKSRRDKWFAFLESTGWKTWGNPIPDILLTHDWERDA